jgi:hypothetical protein
VADPRLGNTEGALKPANVSTKQQRIAELARTNPSCGDAHVHAATWRETIKSKPNGPAEVLRSMRARLGAPRTASGRKELRGAIDYIARQDSLGRMKYVEAQRRGYPIGTGVTEAAAKTVVGTRMKRAGARFSQHGGQTVMLFRTSILSRRFAALHRELGASYAARVKEAA